MLYTFHTLYTLVFHTFHNLVFLHIHNLVFLHIHNLVFPHIHNLVFPHILISHNPAFCSHLNFGYLLNAFFDRSMQLKFVLSSLHFLYDIPLHFTKRNRWLIFAHLLISLCIRPYCKFPKSIRPCFPNYQLAVLLFDFFLFHFLPVPLSFYLVSALYPKR